MMQLPEPPPSRALPFVRRHCIWLAAAVITVASTIAAARVARTPVDGYLVIGTDVDDFDSEIYVGERLVGTGCATVSWAKILGFYGQKPLGIVLPDDAAWPVSRLADTKDVSLPAGPGDATAERLAGKGAAIVHFSYGSPLWSRHGHRHAFVHKEMIIRRADGTLDQVLCLDAAFTDVVGRTYRVLVPIRLRPHDLAEPVTFASSGSYSTDIERDGDEIKSWGRAEVPRNGWIHRISHEWGFKSGEAPEELAAEIREKGLWKPSS